MDSKEIKLDDHGSIGDPDDDLFGRQESEIKPSIHKEPENKDTQSGFFDGDEVKMEEIKDDFIQGLQKGVARKLRKAKLKKTIVKKKGKNINEIKLTFLENLSRLTSNDTKEKALKEICKLFDGTAKDQECLKIYLQQLLERKITKKGFVNFEMEIAALNHLIHLNGKDFIDPRSKANTLDSTIRKVTDLYRLALSVESSQVHKIVAQGFIHILESCIKQEYGLDIVKIQELLLKPLEDAITSGDDKIAKIGAAHCYYFLVKAANEKGYKDLFKYLYTKQLSIFKENYIENDDYINCVSYLVQNGGIKPATPYVGCLINRCLRIIRSSDINNPKAKEAA